MGLFLPDGGRCGGNGAAPAITGAPIITNNIAIALGLLVLGFIAVDLYVYDWAMTLYVARKFVLLIEYLQFWR